MADGGDTFIDLAYRILRKVEGGKEPYHGAVLPMASALHELARDPVFVLGAAETIRRQAGVSLVEILYWERGASETLSVRDGDKVGHGTLVKAYEKLLAARKERADG